MLADRHYYEFCEGDKKKRGCYHALSLLAKKKRKWSAPRQALDENTPLKKLLRSQPKLAWRPTSQVQETPEHHIPSPS